MFRKSNTVIGVINLLTFLLSIPILGGGIWLGSRANQTDCMKFLQWPLIIIGASILVISVVGCAGSCYKVTWLLRLYLFAMFFVIAALLAFIVFAYAVTAKGSGRTVPNRSYLDYSLSDYSGWLKDRVSDPGYWAKIRSCLRDAKACRNMARYVGGVPESAEMFYMRDLSPTQSGCCKPPSACGFTYINETDWIPPSGMTTAVVPDCKLWSNDQDQLCYTCGSCKAGVLASVKKSWRKVSIVNIVVLIFLVIVYIIGCAAFRNNKRLDNDEPYGENRMTKSEPSRMHF
ncbi:tetraspanin-3-like [Tasmannia lanceolata]|uniref:tetraspanin-3-like n=1 Tax=Tasmannia lanceolata TaxID=3420 RepID=UPI0040642FD0